MKIWDAVTGQEVKELEGLRGTVFGLCFSPNGEFVAAADSLGMIDDALEGVEDRETLKPLLEALPPREKKILMLRFFGGLTQSQIAAELGISQMHVSRLLARTLMQLRKGMLAED